jgi:transposase
VAIRTQSPGYGVAIFSVRHYHAEKWTIGTIARQLHVHHSVVHRVLAQAGLPGIGTAPRASQIDAYLPLIRETLEKFPTLTASRLFAMVCERGYPGRPDHFRHLIALHRPRRPAEAYLRLRSLPGEPAQSLPPRRRGWTGGISAICRSAAPAAR